MEKKKPGVVRKSFSDARKALSKGNMIMLAIGLIIGAAFGAVVKSLADDVIMAAIVKFVGVNEKLAEWQVNGIYVGKFLAALLYFVIVFVFLFIFLGSYFLIRNLVIAAREKRKPKEEPAAPAPTTEELILEELKKLNSKK
ncbi:large conductance mechanosensitive channel protein [Mycoplasmopsis californica]|uniref:MscL family protein n=1 Tax=Mycoplasmopsis equigenitalium TaxID=114883 RepID=A0ABY5J106_9BACT|nr:MscL family protein [Mycoplasmopsis equigenitalium]UUD36904.1 MscL family protein [Mycoplasmopsis equigenitalium]VEU69801.1 large conductance mechanosensitive channel protein [Mycoplasmopsis californica]